MGWNHLEAHPIPLETCNPQLLQAPSQSIPGEAEPLECCPQIPEKPRSHKPRKPRPFLWDLFPHSPCFPFLGKPSGLGSQIQGISVPQIPDPQIPSREQEWILQPEPLFRELLPLFPAFPIYTDSFFLQVIIYSLFIIQGFLSLGITHTHTHTHAGKPGKPRYSQLQIRWIWGRILRSSQLFSSQRLKRPGQHRSREFGGLLR